MTPFRLLLVEDSVNDAALVTAELEQAGYLPTTRRVETLEALREALASEPGTWSCPTTGCRASTRWTCCRCCTRRGGTCPSSSCPAS